MQAKPAPNAEQARAEALSSMNLTTIVRAYVQQAIDDVPGYKGLLLDKETMRVCSTMFGRSEFADNNVVCIERLEQNTGKEHQELKVRPGGLQGQRRTTPCNSMLFLRCSLICWAHV